MGLFNRDRNSKHEQRAIGIDGATSAQVRIDMSVGSLRVRGGASDLMNGEFEYDPDLKPEISYDVRDGIGRLNVVQAQGGNVKGLRRNEWDIALNDSLPIDLDIRMATGKLRAELSSLHLVTLQVTHSTGESTVDVGGHQLALRDVSISQATGKLHVDLNGDYAVLRDLNLTTATGAAVVSLAGGAWGQDLDGKITVTTGNAEVRLPSDVGVEVRAAVAMGKISAPDLQRVDGLYVNSCYGQTPATLRLHVQTTIGKLELTVVS